MKAMHALLAAGAVLGVAWVFVPRALPIFTAHMTAHMLVVAVAAPLLALAAQGSAFDVVRQWPTRCSAIAASMLEGVVVWVWHAPALHAAAAQSGWVWALEQLCFLASGAWLWICVLGGGPRIRRTRLAGGIAGLLLTSMHMTLLGALITLADQTLYFDHGGHGDHAAMRWLSPLHDQQLGGAAMLVLGNACYLGGALWLGAIAVRPQSEGAS